MPDQQEIQQQRSLLDAHRATLSIYLRQRALQGEAFAPPAVENGIREARHNIRQIKKTLRSWGAPVADHPDDEEVIAADAGTGGGSSSILSSLAVFVGVVAFFAGFGLFGYVVISFLMLIFTSLGSNDASSPDFSGVPFQLLPVGLGLCFVGIVIAVVGGFKSARRATKGRRSRQ